MADGIHDVLQRLLSRGRSEEEQEPVDNPAEEAAEVRRPPPRTAARFARAAQEQRWQEGAAGARGYSPDADDTPGQRMLRRKVDRDRLMRTMPSGMERLRAEADSARFVEDPRASSRADGPVGRFLNFLTGGP